MDGNILTPSAGQADLTSSKDNAEVPKPSSPSPDRVNCESPVQNPPISQSGFPDVNSPCFTPDPYTAPDRGYPENYGLGPDPDGPPRYFENLGMPTAPDFPQLMLTSQQATNSAPLPPHFFYPPLLYPGYPINLEQAAQTPPFIAQFLYREAIRLPHHAHFPPVKNVVEYRQDLILGASFLPIWALDPSRHFGRNIFVPMQPFVYSVIESVLHYCDQPYATLVKGTWINGIAHLPLAHHICICLDDGFKRYEEVIRVSIMNPDTPKDINMPDAAYISVSHRLRKPAPNRRPTFRTALMKSLQGLISNFSTMPMELSVSRASQRNSEIEKAIIITVRDCHEEFETFFYPLIQNVFQTFSIRLTGTHYIVSGHFFRPLMFSATLMLSSGEKQILDTVNLHFNFKDRRICATSIDTSIAEISYDERGKIAMGIMQSCEFSDGGGQVWGPPVPMAGLRIPLVCHPFVNLSLNPALNRNFNPYHTYAFNTPPVFCSRTSCFPPPYRPGYAEGNPLPYFYPMVTPVGMPLSGFPPMEPHHDPHLIHGDGPGMNYGSGSGMPSSTVNHGSEVDQCQGDAHFEPDSSRNASDSENLAGTNSHKSEAENQQTEAEHEDGDESRASTPSEEQDNETKQFNNSATLKLNPNASDFVPRSMTSPPMSPCAPPLFSEPLTHAPPQMFPPPPPFPIPFPILKIGPQIISMQEPCLDSGSDYFSDEEMLGELEMVSLHHPVPIIHNASSSDSSVLVSHCTDTQAFIKNMDSQSSALDTGIGSDSTITVGKKKKSRSKARGGRSDQERSSGVEDHDGVPEVSIHKSWSEEVEASAHNNPGFMDIEPIYRIAPPPPQQPDYVNICYDPCKSKRGSVGGPRPPYRGRGGPNRGEWRKHPAQWRDNRYEQGPNNFEGPPPPFPSKANYFQRRNQCYENHRFKQDGSCSYGPGGGNDGPFYGGRGRGWRGARGYRPHYGQNSEYHHYGEGEQGGRRGNHAFSHNNHHGYYNNDYYMDERDRNEGYMSADPDQENISYSAAVTRSQQCCTAAPETSEHKSDPNSEESHGEGGPLILTETTFTNSQNSSYRNFNNSANSSGRGRGYRGTYSRSYENNNRSQNNSRDPSRDGDDGYYGGQRPIGQNWISKKYRKFNDNESARGESNILEAFTEDEGCSNQGRPGMKSSRYSFSQHRNLIQIRTSTISESEDFPPLSSEQSRQSSPPATPKAEPTAPAQSKKKQKKYKKTKTRKDGEVVGSSDDETLRSSGSTPRAKRIIPTPAEEVIPGDGVYNEPSKPATGAPAKPCNSADTTDLSERSEISSLPMKKAINWDSAACGEPSE